MLADGPRRPRGGVAALDVAGVRAARARASALRSALAERGLSERSRTRLFGARAPDTSDLGGLAPGAGNDAIADARANAPFGDLEDVPGFGGGIDLTAAETRQEAMGGLLGRGKIVYRAHGIRVTRLPGGGHKVSRGANTLPMTMQRNKDGSKTVTVTNDKGTKLDITVPKKGSKKKVKVEPALVAPKKEKKDGDAPPPKKEDSSGEEKEEKETEDPKAKPDQDPKERPADDGRHAGEVTEEVVARWEARRNGLVDPPAPDHEVEHDIGRLVTAIVVREQSVVNPNPADEGGGGGDGEAGGRNPGAGVVDPPDENPQVRPTKTKGPKPLVGVPPLPPGVMGGGDGPPGR